MAPCQPFKSGHVRMRMDTGCDAKRAVPLRKRVGRFARAPVKARAAVMSEIAMKMRAIRLGGRLCWQELLVLGERLITLLTLW